MASAGKRHCASCIGTLLFPIGFEDERRFLGDGGCVTRGSVTSAERVHTFCRRRRRRGRSNRRVWLSNHISITAHTGGTSRQFGRGIKQVSLALCCEIYTSLFAQIAASKTRNLKKNRRKRKTHNVSKKSVQAMFIPHSP